MGRLVFVTSLVLWLAGSAFAQDPPQDYQLSAPALSAPQEKPQRVLYAAPQPARRDNTRWLIYAGIALVVLSVVQMARDKTSQNRQDGADE